MKKNLYAVYDTKAEEVIGGVLYAFPHDAVAVRMFTDAYQAEGTTINKHPEDFELISLGTMENTAITPELRIVITGAALNALAKNQQQERR